ncbi:MAG: hypothetical protein QNJ77_00865 [Acidimicrobiia bacterium]|nr:hypothetical protein [Acidimicrobiia bacterium]
MRDLEWFETSDGYDCLEYRIRRDGERPRVPWKLENSEAAAHRAGRRRLRPSFHATARQAMEFAQRVERSRSRRIRALGQVAIGVVAGAAFVSLVPVIASPGNFVIGVVTFFVALRAFAHAVSIVAGDAWGWSREQGSEERITATDRLILAVAERFRGRTLAAVEFDPERRVHELPPEEPEER